MRYFALARERRPFLDIVSAIITNDLGSLVRSSDLARWEETLALLSTYGKSDEFAGLCEQLGERLERETEDEASAALCFMCAVNAHKALQFWLADFERASAKLGRTDTRALQSLVEKVTIFAREPPNASDAARRLDTLRFL